MFEPKKDSQESISSIQTDYDSKFRLHDNLLKSQKDQIGRIEQLQREILKAQKPAHHKIPIPQQTFIYNNPVNLTNENTGNSPSAVQHSNNLLEKITEQ